ncbi:MAG TPA: hypothetical protein VE242_05995 [Chthoniobacterales bacterium]|nr:hypothetical protein [Chthoniobacterales bacterium]
MLKLRRFTRDLTGNISTIHGDRESTAVCSVDTDPYSGATLAETVMANQDDLDEARLRF